MLCMISLHNRYSTSYTLRVSSLQVSSDLVFAIVVIIELIRLSNSELIFQSISILLPPLFIYYKYLHPCSFHKENSDRLLLFRRLSENKAPMIHNQCEMLIYLHFLCFTVIFQSKSIDMFFHLLLKMSNGCKRPTTLSTSNLFI